MGIKMERKIHICPKCFKLNNKHPGWRKGTGQCLESEIGKQECKRFLPNDDHVRETQENIGGGAVFLGFVLLYHSATD